MDQASASSDDASVHEAREVGSIMNFISAKKVSSSLWFLRIYIIFLSTQFIFFAHGLPLDHYFQRAMIANMIICTLRVQQRIPDFKFNRRHFAKALQEDSAHYLIYSIIFLTCQPITIALLPVSLFALLHACNFGRQVLDVHGAHSYYFLRRSINAVAKYQSSVFRFIALDEIILMPTTVIMLVFGRANPIAPFMYYKFMHYRYLSKRNPYSRLVFYELRMAALQTIRAPSTPGFMQWCLEKVITVTCKLGPAIPLRETVEEQRANAD